MNGNLIAFLTQKTFGGMTALAWGEVTVIAIILWHLLVLWLDMRSAHRSLVNNDDGMLEYLDSAGGKLAALADKKGQTDWQQEKVALRRNLSSESLIVFKAVDAVVVAAASAVDARARLADADFGDLDPLTQRAEAFKETVPLVAIVGTSANIALAAASPGQGLESYTAAIGHAIGFNCIMCCFVIAFSALYYRNLAMADRVTASVANLSDALFHVTQRWRAQNETTQSERPKGRSVEALDRPQHVPFRFQPADPAPGAGRRAPATAV